LRERKESLMIKNVWLAFSRLFSGITLPYSLEDLRGKILLHFSDTPSTFYGGMRHLIRLLQPLCVVHTGDFADDIKLELRPGELSRYRMKLSELAGVLAPVEKRHIVLVTGNHDHEGSVREIFQGSTVFAGNGRIDLYGLDLNLSHAPKDLQKPLGRFNLFGHEPVMHRNCKEGMPLLLNGLYSMHVVNIKTGEVFYLPYPGYVDDARLNRRKIGL